MANITVYEFMILNTEDRYEPFLLWNIENAEYIYEGNLSGISFEYKDLIVQSWNIEYSQKYERNVVCLNVSLED